MALTTRSGKGSALSQAEVDTNWNGLANGSLLGTNSNGTVSMTGNLTMTGRVTAATGNVSGNMTVGGNETVAGNLTVSGAITATGNVAGGNLTTAGAVNGATANITGNMTGGNISTGNLTLSGKVNKITITAPATGATQSQADNSSLNTVGAFNITLTAAANVNATLPSGNVTVAAQSGAGAANEFIAIAVSDEVTPLTTGTAKVTFRMPYPFTLSSVRASLSTAQTSGSLLTVNVKESGTTIFSTKITLDNTEKTTTTAATPPVLSDTSLADDAEITIDIDQIGDGTAKGLKVYLIGKKT